MGMIMPGTVLYGPEMSVSCADQARIRLPAGSVLGYPAEILLTEVQLTSRCRDIAIHSLTTPRHVAYGETFQTLINLQPFLVCTTTPSMSQPTRHVRAIDTGTSIGPQTSPAIIDSSQICLGSIRWIKK
jgi:hypothetical protein